MALNNDYFDYNNYDWGGTGADAAVDDSVWDWSYEGWDTSWDTGWESSNSWEDVSEPEWNLGSSYMKPDDSPIMAELMEDEEVKGDFKDKKEPTEEDKSALDKLLNSKGGLSLLSGLIQGGFSEWQRQQSADRADELSELQHERNKELLALKQAGGSGGTPPAQTIADRPSTAGSGKPIKGTFEKRK